MLLRRSFSHSGSGFHFFQRNKVGLAALLVFQHVILGGIVMHDALEGMGVVVLTGIHANKTRGNIRAVIRDALCIVQHIQEHNAGVNGAHAVLQAQDGVSFADAAGPAAFVTYIRAILLRDTGATISPFNAFLLLQGTETLSLRIERHVENTKKVVEFLANHPQVEKVNHPSLPDHPDHALYEKYFPNGGASIFTFNIKGGREEAFKFIDNLKIFSLLANVADVKSLVIHPASTTHSQLNDQELAEQQIYQNTIRLSIGTEHIDDIIADLEAGFTAVRGE